MTCHVNTTTKSMYQQEKSALRTYTHTRPNLFGLQIINFPKNYQKYIFPRVYTIILSFSCRRFVSSHKPILYYCIFMKFVNTQNDLKLCSCRVSDLTHVFISANQMKDFSSFLFCFSYSTLLNALVHYIAHIPTADAAPETNLCLLPMS